MKKSSKNSSFLSGVFRLFKGSPAQKARKNSQQRRPGSPGKRSNQTPAGGDFPYRAAEIVVEDCACDAVTVLTGTRFLMDEVPHIPVTDCTSRKCTCTYVRHQDRRTLYEDRRAEFSALSNAYTTIGNTERRASRGRRAGDVPPGQSL